MIIPANNPAITEKDNPIQFSNPSKYKITNVKTAMKKALVFTPLFKAFISIFMSASSLVLTKKIPKIDKKTPIAAIIIGANTAFCCISGFAIKADAPRAAVERMDPQYDSYRSAPIPATSPTLSPTLSAMVAGFRGSSSGMPASTLPTKSAPTSAAFV